MRAAEECISRHLLAISEEWEKIAADELRGLKLEALSAGNRIGGRHPVIADSIINQNYYKALEALDTGVDLNWDSLKYIQSLVLNIPVEAVSFRTGPAFSQNGGRVHLYSASIKEIFFRRLNTHACSDSDSFITSISLYLDIIFFHPFADGNGRAARLWMDFILRKASLPGPDYAAIMRIPKIAGDKTSYIDFAKYCLLNIISRANACPNNLKNRI